MRLYPTESSRRQRTLVGDLLVLVALVVFAWLGLKVYDAVDRLTVLGEGVSGAGGAVQGGFDSVADQIESAPLVGGTLADAFRFGGEGTGGNVADLGDRGEQAAHELAVILGLLVFGLPALFLLALWLPGRVRQVRAMTAAERVLTDVDSPDRRRLLAMRAAFGLPYGRLLEYTADPLGDLAAERYDALVAAALEDAGLRLPPR